MATKKVTKPETTEEVVEVNPLACAWCLHIIPVPGWVEDDKGNKFCSLACRQFGPK